MANNEASGKGVQSAGDVEIAECILIKNDGSELDLRQYVGEINVYEDMFKNGMYGNILIIDTGNLSQNFPIVGEEFIRLKIKTPSFQSEINRVFKVYSISNKMLLRDTNTQSYILHYTSPEVFLDLMSPLYSTYEGKLGDVVRKIWEESLATTRLGDSDEAVTPLIILGEPENDVKFTSPGWSPMHCLNWLAARARGEGYKNPGYLFYESNKAFYFVNVEALIDESIKTKSIFAEYMYMANNVSADTGSQVGDNFTTNRPYSKDIEKEYKKVEDFEVLETYNNFKNVQNGYYANRLITLDIMTKKYETYDYDHVASYDEYKHLENISGATDVAPFRADTLRSPSSFVQFYPKHENLYNGFANNVGDVIETTLPRRLSTIQELSNFKIIFTVPGRVDAEVGSVIYFSYPDTSPRDQSDTSKPKEDAYYSGYYLVTAIRHKITLKKHMMIMEAVKDSYRKEPTK
jgi:hypothetical protein